MRASSKVWMRGGGGRERHCKGSKRVSTWNLKDDMDASACLAAGFARDHRLQGNGVPLP